MGVATQNAANFIGKFLGYIDDISTSDGLLLFGEPHLHNLCHCTHAYLLFLSLYHAAFRIALYLSHAIVATVSEVNSLAYIMDTSIHAYIDRDRVTFVLKLNHA